MTDKEKFDIIVNKIKQHDQGNWLGSAVYDTKFYLGYDESMNEIYVIDTSDEQGRNRVFDSDGDDIDDLIDFLGQRFPKIFDGVKDDTLS